MSPRWLILLLLPAAALFAVATPSSDPLQQTVFLERVAAKVERAATIPPETERAIRHAVRSIRRDGARLNEQLDTRQRLAVQRIEDTLWSHTGSLQRNGTVAPEIADDRYQSPSLAGDGGGPMKPLRPLYPFQPGEASASEPSSFESRR